MTHHLPSNWNYLNIWNCLTFYNFREHTAKLNPIGDGYISPAQARSEATLTMTLQREGILYIPSFKTGTIWIGEIILKEFKLLHVLQQS